MKKFVGKILCAAMVFSAVQPAVFAKNGDIIGYTKYSDVGAYINHYPITSFNINGNTAVVAEDLQNYGFSAEWNGTERSLSITRNEEATQITPYGTVYKNSANAGKNASPYLETDIMVYVNGEKVESFNIGGKTCIYLEALRPYGEVVWVPEVRAIKMWIDGLPVTDYKVIDEEPVAAAPKISYAANSNYDSTRQILSKCERYVTLANAAADVMSAELDVYKLNGKASHVTSMQKKITDITSYTTKIRSLTADDRRLYLLYSNADIAPVSATSTASVSSYIRKVKNLKAAYDSCCSIYGK